jgi:hypothetical protein
MAVEVLLRKGTGADWAMAERTLQAMADGGMFDHLGGGFSRYSVDEKWLVPHFEKMLYDNAQLAACYLDAFQATGNPRYRTIARETLDYILRDLRDPAGGFHSSEDADSEGEEGRFYVFTPTQVASVLGPGDGARFCSAYGITPAGNFEHGASVLHRFDAPPGPADADLDSLRERLRAHRDTRIRPGKDDKVLAAWNGLALTAFARGFQVLGEPRYLEAATALAAFLRRDMARGGGLLRSWRQGPGQTPGFLEDYAAVAGGLVDLYEAGFDPAWLRWAGELGQELTARFADPGQDGFFGTVPSPDLLLRTQPIHDGAMPSGNTLAARALLRLDQHLDRPDFREAALGVLRRAAPMLNQTPEIALGLVSVLDLALSPMEIVIAGDPRAPETRALLAAARKPFLPNRAVSLAAADPQLPLHQGRASLQPMAFVCRNRACAAPVTDPQALERLLA